MTDSDRFATAVGGVTGVWPEPPAVWSFSSLRDAEECPRRWGLARANYPNVWEGRGYPPRPNLPSVVGDIIHRSLDVILRALYERGCSSISDPGAADALRDLGGYTALLEREVESQLEHLRSNPRMCDRVVAFGTALRSRVPEIRQRLQSIVARATLIPTQPLANLHATSSEGQTPLVEGSHPEVSLRVDELRFAGRADLLTLTDRGCAIIDYKTGSPNDHHAEQIRIYQLLWSRDHSRNPNAAPVTSLTLSYATHDVTLAPLDRTELEDLRDELCRRIEAADLEVGFRPPPARPSADMCRLCDVRHLCEDYWESSAFSDDGRTFVDRQGTVVTRNGPKSWLLQIETPHRERILLRTQSEQPGFAIGSDVRLLDVLATRDDDREVEIVNMTHSSEVFDLVKAG